MMNAFEAYGARPENLLREFSRSQLIIVTNNSKCILFDVYVAQTPSQRSQGLMYIESLGSHEGMIFLYRESVRISMWMKNTLIPLDMLFIDIKHGIVSMRLDAVPHSEETIESGKEVVAVIELNAGSVEFFKISTGNRIIFPAG
jgi:uncharacterized membrane protein (UPF0127 family)